MISGNGGDGVGILEAGASNNTVLGNFIGTDVSGTEVISNDHTTPGSLGFSSNGVFLVFGSHDNVIGGTTQRESNLISGNHDYGVHLNGQGTSGNVIRGNLIGTDITGSASLGNRLDGVHIHGGSDNFVGMLGPFGAGTRNVISGNFGDGVHLHSAGATGNVIKGNRIGTDATGNDALPNDTGVTILDVGGNTVGGSSPFSDRNLVSGNTNGIVVSGANAIGNQIKRNFIGTNAKGTGSLGNVFDGIVLTSSASLNVIGDRNSPAVRYFGGGAISSLETGEMELRSRPVITTTKR